MSEDAADAPVATDAQEIELFNQIMTKIEMGQESEAYCDELIAEKHKELEQIKKAHTAKIAQITKQSRKNRSKQRAAAGVGDHAASAFTDEGRTEVQDEDEDEEQETDVPFELRQKLAHGFQSPSGDSIDFYKASGSDIVQYLQRRSNTMRCLIQDMKEFHDAAPSFAKSTDEHRQIAIHKYLQFGADCKSYGIP